MRQSILAAAAFLALTSGADAAALGHGLRFAGLTPTPAVAAPSSAPTQTAADSAR